MGFGPYSISAELLNIMGCWLQSNFITQFIHLTSVLADRVLVIVGDIFSVDAQRARIASVAYPYPAGNESQQRFRAADVTWSVHLQVHR